LRISRAEPDATPATDWSVRSLILIRFPGFVAVRNCLLKERAISEILVEPVRETGRLFI